MTGVSPSAATGHSSHREDPTNTGGPAAHRGGFYQELSRRSPNCQTTVRHSRETLSQREAELALTKPALAQTGGPVCH